ncbi:bis(5'-nucleosyl)-tetraphosphatase (symmetrical) YqeK [Clostridium sp. OS1-26]|uniref:bis(5'-nucleosyl)-tetraphosphatase (symmetrical) YqeK n=1 Tax=Clostridium sp. OS1-26 TaxID=3070681 RepID=UPI0027DEC669|nr:bis(5'-nucleosyl)-tetraphosphatase (symmetrical) YqeK [Clostridium sp. OS1-26]WML35680.1 bis(5'-nucleosyl)-tetraphosphatase (symmetrical) YqeK [Clostridium sp. OS1-26]
MWSEDRIQDYLKQNLKYKRYEHSLSVRDTAVKLAEIYNVDIEKARIAGLTHDCAKNMNDDQLLNIASNHKIRIDEVCQESPQLIHGAVGAVIANEIMGISDEEILNAISYHTTGRKNMSMLDKIIYIADYIEPLRNFPGVEELRNIAFKDIDKSLLKSFDNTIKFVIDRGQLLHFDTIEARNYVLFIK